MRNRITRKGLKVATTHLGRLILIDDPVNHVNAKQLFDLFTSKPNVCATNKNTIR